MVKPDGHEGTIDACAARRAGEEGNTKDNRRERRAARATGRKMLQRLARAVDTKRKAMRR